MDLVSGGLDLFRDRPLWGYGGGSFQKEFRAKHESSRRRAAAASHTIPITVAAEQGIVGLAVYLALLAAAFARLWARTFTSPRRSAVAAAFTALVFHTLLYAAFLEDPLTGPCSASARRWPGSWSPHRASARWRARNAARRAAPRGPARGSRAAGATAKTSRIPGYNPETATL